MRKGRREEGRERNTTAENSSCRVCVCVCRCVSVSVSASVCGCEWHIPSQLLQRAT